MLDFVTFGFLILTAFVIVLAINKSKPDPRPRDDLKGPVLLTVGGKIKNPNRKSFDLSTDNLFKKNNIFFASAVQYDAKALGELDQKKIKFIGPGEDTTYEGPELKTVLEDAGADYKVAVAYGSTKNQPLYKSAIEAETWLVALKRNGKGLGAGEDGPLLLLSHPGGETVAFEDRSKWVAGLFAIDARS